MHPQESDIRNSQGDANQEKAVPIKDNENKRDLIESTKPSSPS